MVWSCVLYAVVRRRFCRMCIHAHAHLLTLNEQALGRLQGRVGKLPRRHSLIFICARIRFMVLFVLCRFYIFGLMIKLFKHMEKCVCVWRVWLHVRYARHVLMLGRWWFSFAVGLFFKFFLAFSLKCSHFVVVATNICYNIPESHSFAHAKWCTLAYIPTHTEGRFYARFNISTDKFDSISQLNWLRVDAAAASF